MESRAPVPQATPVKQPNEPHTRFREIAMNRFNTTILVAAVTAISPHLTFAYPPDPPRVTVRFADLDLSRPEGAQTLYSRLRRAAEQVCIQVESESGLSWAFSARKACIEKATADAIAKVNRPLLTAYGHSKTGPRAVAPLAAAGPP